jgi:hypothetical protein
MARLSRLWTLRSVDNIAGMATERSLGLLSLLSLALWTGIERLRAGPGASFNEFGIPDLGLAVLMILLLAFVLAFWAYAAAPSRALGAGGGRRPSRANAAALESSPTDACQILPNELDSNGEHHEYFPPR